MEAPVNTSLEVPFRPGWPAPHESHIEPPFVPLEPRWEYKELVREVAAGLLSEAELNALGAEHWELTGVIAAGAQAHFYFKRERHF
jgi:hypothetical protein